MTWSKQEMLSEIMMICTGLTRAVGSDRFSSSGCSIQHHVERTSHHIQRRFRISGTQIPGETYELRNVLGGWQLQQLVKDEPASVGWCGVWRLRHALQKIARKAERDRAQKNRRATLA